MTAQEFRALALAYPGAIEKAHLSHPDFRIRGRVFASLDSPDSGWAMVRLTPDQQTTMLRRAPKGFRPANGAWGTQGYTNIFLADAASADVAIALRFAVDELMGPSAKR